MEDYVKQLMRHRLLRRSLAITTALTLLFLYLNLEIDSPEIVFALSVLAIVCVLNFLVVFTYKCPRCGEVFYERSASSTSKKYLDFFTSSCKNCDLSLKIDFKAIANRNLKTSIAKRAFNKTFQHLSSQHGGSVSQTSDDICYKLDDVMVYVRTVEGSKEYIGLEIQVAGNYPDWITSPHLIDALKGRPGVEKLMEQIRVRGYFLDFGTRILRADKNADSKDTNTQSLWEVISWMQELSSSCSSFNPKLNIDALPTPKQCPYCMEEIHDTQGIVYCSLCRAAQHQDCFAANKGCSVFGCTSFSALPILKP